MEKLKNYNRPGNVREMENVLERILIMKKDANVIKQEDFSIVVENKLSVKEEVSFKEAKKIFEKNYIISYLSYNVWKIEKTAKALGVSRFQLYRKIKSLGIKKYK